MYENVILSSGGFKTEGYLKELLEIMDNTDSNTIFYGSSMGAFWAIGTLLEKYIDEYDNARETICRRSA